MKLQFGFITANLILFSSGFLHLSNVTERRPSVVHCETLTEAGRLINMKADRR